MSSKRHKQKFGVFLLDIIKTWSPHPGRFLKRKKISSKEDNETKDEDDVPEVYEELSDKSAIEKIRQALREGAPKIEKMIDDMSSEEQYRWYETFNQRFPNFSLDHDCKDKYSNLFSYHQHQKTIHQQQRQGSNGGDYQEVAKKQHFHPYQYEHEMSIGEGYCDMSISKDLSMLSMTNFEGLEEGLEVEESFPKRNNTSIATPSDSIFPSAFDDSGISVLSATDGKNLHRLLLRSDSLSTKKSCSTTMMSNKQESSTFSFIDEDSNNCLEKKKYHQNSLASCSIVVPTQIPDKRSSTFSPSCGMLDIRKKPAQVKKKETSIDLEELMKESGNENIQSDLSLNNNNNNNDRDNAAVTSSDVSAFSSVLDFDMMMR